MRLDFKPLCCIVLVLATSQAYAGDANTLVQVCNTDKPLERGYCDGFISAVADMPGFEETCIDKYEPKQIINAVVKTMRKAQQDTPELGRVDAVTAVGAAMTYLFPCKGPQPAANVPQ